MDQLEKYAEIIKLINEYNETAIKEDSSVRLGLAESCADRSNKDDNSSYQEHIKSEGWYDAASVSISGGLNAIGWFPSAVCV